MKNFRNTSYEVISSMETGSNESANMEPHV